jgi:predicted transcriptional regulator
MGTASSLKQELHALADSLPDGATWDDVIEQARLRKAVEEGLAAADRGEFASPEDVRKTFSRWGVRT